MARALAQPPRPNEGGGAGVGGLSPPGRVKSVLVLGEAGSLNLTALRLALGAQLAPRTIAVASPLEVYESAPHRFPRRLIDMEATFAEKALCKDAALFVGDQRSTFSAHVSALGAAAHGAGWEARQTLSRSGRCYLPEVYDGEGLWCYA